MGVYPVIRILNLGTVLVSLIGFTMLMSSNLSAQEADQDVLYLQEMANSAYYNDDYDEAIDYAEQALINLVGTEEYELMAENHLIIAQAHLKSKQAASALKSFFQALNSVEKSGNMNSMGVVYTEIGMLYENLGLPKKAIEYYQQARDLREEMEDTEGIMMNLEQLGRSFMAMDSLDLALSFFSQLLDYNLENGKVDGVIISLRKLVSIYQKKGEYNKALGHNQEILDLVKGIGDSVEIASAYNNLAYNFSIIEDYEEALDYFLRTLDMDKRMRKNDSVIVTDHINLAITYQNLGMIDDAFDNLQKGLTRISGSKYPGKEAEIHNLLATFYLQQNDFHNANQFCLSAIELAQKANNAEILKNSYRTYSSLLQNGNDFEKALFYYQAFLRIRDSLLLEEIYLEQVSSQQQFSMERTEKELRLLLAEEEVKDLQLKQLQLEQDKRLKELELLRTDRELQQMALNREEIEKDRAIKALQIAQQRILSQRRDQDFLELQQDQKLQAMALEQSKLAEEKQRQDNLLLQQKTKEQTLILDASNRQKKYMALILGLLLSILLLIIFGYLQIRANSRKLQSSKEELEVTLDDLTYTHKQLQETQTKLVESEKMASLGQLTAGIAHEINNPINFVSSNISPLKKDIDELKDLINNLSSENGKHTSEEELKSLKQKIQQADTPFLFEEIEQLLFGIEEGANRTKEIVVGLRNFSRLDEAEFKEADIHQGLDSTLTLLNNRMKNNISIIREYGQVPLVQCLPGKLNQVFMNVFTNAIQAMDETGGKIRIKTLFHPKGNGAFNENYPQVRGDAVFISISDTGRGMDQETKKRVFEPFFTTKEVGQGTGLGLSISYGIIEQHQGIITVSSEKGEGTSFNIVLPVNHIDQPG